MASNATDRFCASGGPVLTWVRVPRSPSPSRRAAAASVVIGPLSQRARPIATSAAATRPAAATPLISDHSTITRWSRPAVDLDSTTVPTEPDPPSGTTGATTTRRSPDG